MSTYDILCEIVPTDGHAIDKRVWKGLTKEEVITIERRMVSYLEDLVKANQRRLKGDLEDPIDLNPSPPCSLNTSCVITKDGVEWAATTFRLHNLSGVQINILSLIFSTHISKLPKTIRSKMTRTT